MQRDPKAYLYDIQQAAELLESFIEGRALDDYETDSMLRSAVERQLMIVGEAISQLARREPELVERITEYRQIIGLRNVIVHGYADIDHVLVWDTLRAQLTVLKREVETLLAE